MAPTRREWILKDLLVSRLRWQRRSKYSHLWVLAGQDWRVDLAGGEHADVVVNRIICGRGEKMEYRGMYGGVLNSVWTM